MKHHIEHNNPEGHTEEGISRPESPEAFSEIIKKTEQEFKNNETLLRMQLEASGKYSQKAFQLGLNFLSKNRSFLLSAIYLLSIATAGTVTGEVIGNHLEKRKTTKKAVTWFSGIEDRVEDNAKNPKEQLDKIISGRADSALDQRTVVFDKQLMEQYSEKYKEQVLEQFDILIERQLQHDMKEYNKLHAASAEPQRTTEDKQDIWRAAVGYAKNLRQNVKRSSDLKEIDPEKVKKYLLQGAKEMQEAYEHHDRQLAWFLEKVESDTYKERLLLEGFSEQEFEERKQKLTDQDYVLHRGQRTGQSVHGHYSHRDESVHLPSETYSDLGRKEEDMVAIHEAAHDITDGRFGMSEYARKTYKEAFLPEKLLESERKDYFSEPTELDARKKAVEYFMEQNNIKKYDEEFTEEHTKKLQKLLRRGIVTPHTNVEQFLRMTDSKYWPQIFNTIAENKVAGDDIENENFA